MKQLGCRLAQGWSHVAIEEYSSWPDSTQQCVTLTLHYPVRTPSKERPVGKGVFKMPHPSTQTPLPPLILTPGGLVPISAAQNPQLDSTETKHLNDFDIFSLLRRLVY
eukprot:1179981-Amphidinium_carterae.1